jgi:hypothetical protein
VARGRIDAPTAPVCSVFVSPNGMVAPVSLAVFVPVVLVLCGLAVLLIIIGPSRRVRAERPLDPDTEAALLLGEDPERVEAEQPSEPEGDGDPLRDGRRRDAG